MENKQYSKWSVAQIIAWITEELKIQIDVKMWQQMNIDGSQIEIIDEDMLELALGMESKSQRQLLLSKIDDLKKPPVKQVPEKAEVVKVVVMERKKPIDIHMQEIIDNKSQYTQKSISALDWLKFNLYEKFVAQKQIDEALVRETLKTKLLNEEKYNPEWLDQQYSLKQILHKMEPFNFKILKSLMKKSELQAQKIKSARVIMLIGGTGCGKSTTIQYLGGSILERQKINGLPHIGVKEYGPDQELKNISLSPSSVSETRHIHTIEVKSSSKHTYYLCDTMGLNDTNGEEMNLSNIYGLVQAAQLCSQVLPVVVLSKNSLGDRLTGLKSISRDVSNMISNPSKNMSRIQFLFTNFNTPQEIMVLKSQLQEVFQNLNERERSDQAYVEFFQQILRSFNEECIIDPFNYDQRKRILSYLQSQDFIDDPKQAFQMVISTDSRTAIQNFIEEIRKTILKKIGLKQVDETMFEELKFLRNKFANIGFIQDVQSELVEFAKNMITQSETQCEQIGQNCLGSMKPITVDSLKFLKEENVFQKKLGALIDHDNIKDIRLTVDRLVAGYLDDLLNQEFAVNQSGSRDLVALKNIDEVFSCKNAMVGVSSQISAEIGSNIKQVLTSQDFIEIDEAIQKNNSIRRKIEQHLPIEVPQMDQNVLNKIQNLSAECLSNLNQNGENIESLSQKYKQLKQATTLKLWGQDASLKIQIIQVKVVQLNISQLEQIERNFKSCADIQDLVSISLQIYAQFYQEITALKNPENILLSIAQKINMNFQTIINSLQQNQVPENVDSFLKQLKVFEFYNEPEYKDYYKRFHSEVESFQGRLKDSGYKMLNAYEFEQTKQNIGKMEDLRKYCRDGSQIAYLKQEYHEKVQQTLTNIKNWSNVSGFSLDFYLVEKNLSILESLKNESEEIQKLTSDVAQKLKQEIKVKITSRNWVEFQVLIQKLPDSKRYPQYAQIIDFELVFEDMKQFLKVIHAELKNDLDIATTQFQLETILQTLSEMKGLNKYVNFEDLSQQLEKKLKQDNKQSIRYMQDCLSENDVVQAVEYLKGLIHDFQAVKRFKIYLQNQMDVVQTGMISISYNSKPIDFLDFQLSIQRLEKIKSELEKKFEGNELVDNLILALKNKAQEGQNLLQKVIEQTMQEGVTMAQNNEFDKVMFIKECLDQILQSINLPQDFTERIKIVLEQLSGQIKNRIETFIDQDFKHFLNDDLKNFVSQPKSALIDEQCQILLQHINKKYIARLECFRSQNDHISHDFQIFKNSIEYLPKKQKVELMKKVKELEESSEKVSIANLLEIDAIERLEKLVIQNVPGVEKKIKDKLKSLLKNPFREETYQRLLKYEKVFSNWKVFEQFAEKVAQEISRINDRLEEIKSNYDIKNQNAYINALNSLHMLYTNGLPVSTKIKLEPLLDILTQFLKGFSNTQNQIIKQMPMVANKDFISQINYVLKMSKSLYTLNHLIQLANHEEQLLKHPQIIKFESYSEYSNQIVGAIQRMVDNEEYYGLDQFQFIDLQISINHNQKKVKLSQLHDHLLKYAMQISQNLEIIGIDDFIWWLKKVERAFGFKIDYQKICQLHKSRVDKHRLTISENILELKKYSFLVQAFRNMYDDQIDKTLEKQSDVNIQTLEQSIYGRAILSSHKHFKSYRVQKCIENFHVEEDGNELSEFRKIYGYQDRGANRFLGLLSGLQKKSEKTLIDGMREGLSKRLHLNLQCPHKVLGTVAYVFAFWTKLAIEYGVRKPTDQQVEAVMSLLTEPKQILIEMGPKKGKSLVIGVAAICAVIMGAPSVKIVSSIINVDTREFCDRLGLANKIQMVRDIAPNEVDSDTLIYFDDISEPIFKITNYKNSAVCGSISMLTPLQIQMLQRNYRIMSQVQPDECYKLKFNLRDDLFVEFEQDYMRRVYSILEHDSSNKDEITVVIFPNTTMLVQTFELEKPNAQMIRTYEEVPVQNLVFTTFMYQKSCLSKINEHFTLIQVGLQATCDQVFIDGLDCTYKLVVPQPHINQLNLKERATQLIKEDKREVLYKELKQAMGRHDEKRLQLQLFNQNNGK